MPIFCLFIEHAATGYVSVRTYPTAFDRALEMILLSAQPVILRTAEYQVWHGETAALAADGGH
jgi:hypothetical protein